MVSGKYNKDYIFKKSLLIKDAISQGPSFSLSKQISARAAVLLLLELVCKLGAENVEGNTVEII